MGVRLFLQKASGGKRIIVRNLCPKNTPADFQRGCFFAANKCFQKREIIYIIYAIEKLDMNAADMTALARSLRKVDFFAPMTIGQLELVLPYIMLYEYSKGETVFKQGAQGDALFIVHEGSVSVQIKKGFFGFSKKVAVLGSGNFFGEMALITREPRSATIVCESEAKLFVLLSIDFETVVKKNPSFAAELNKIAQRRKAVASLGK